jgi:hypothetical protein
MNKWNRVIAGMQIVGGGLGLIRVINILGSELSSGVFGQLLGGGVMGLYVLHIFAGGLLWQQHLLGLRLSTVLQALQIPYFSLMALSYRLVAPLGVMLFIKSGQTQLIDSNLYYEFFYHSSWHFERWPQGGTFFLGVNVVAVISFWYLRRQQVVREVIVSPAR